MRRVLIAIGWTVLALVGSALVIFLFVSSLRAIDRHSKRVAEEKQAAIEAKAAQEKVQAETEAQKKIARAEAEARRVEKQITRAKEILSEQFVLKGEMYIPKDEDDFMLFKVKRSDPTTVKVKDLYVSKSQMFPYFVKTNMALMIRIRFTPIADGYRYIPLDKSIDAYGGANSFDGSPKLLASIPVTKRDTKTMTVRADTFDYLDLPYTRCQKLFDAIAANAVLVQFIADGESVNPTVLGAPSHDTYVEYYTGDPMHKQFASALLIHKLMQPE